MVIARTETEVRTLAERLGGCDRIVVEEYQPFTRTMCLNWAADHTGDGALHRFGRPGGGQRRHLPEQLDRP